MKKVLVVDIGGTNVKAMFSREARRKFSSGASLTPRQLHDMLDGQLDDWNYDVVTVGFPAPVRNGRILTEMQRAFVVDYIVLGGGNAKLLEHLPPGVELGHNRNAYLGGQRIWQNHTRTHRPKWTIL